QGMAPGSRLPAGQAPKGGTEGEDHMDQPTRLPRRHFLIAAGSAGVAVALPTGGSGALAQEAKPLPGYVSWKNPDAMIVHSSNTLETKRGFIGTSGITPEDELYIRNNIAPPGDSIVADRRSEERRVGK